MDLSRQKIGEIEVLEKPGKTGGTCITFLHGFGASMEDLAPLSDILALPAGTRWVFPNGLLEVQIGPMMTGRAWFPLDVAALEQSMLSGVPRDFSTDIPPGFVEANEKMAAFTQQLLNEHSEVYLGGFSQGAMLACDIALEHKLNLAGLILLSANLVAKERWQKFIDTLVNPAKLRVFQSHGEQDNILGYQGAVALNELFKTNNVTSEFHNFIGGHEIPADIIVALNKFLQS